MQRPTLDMSFRLFDLIVIGFIVFASAHVHGMMGSLTEFVTGITDFHKDARTQLTGIHAIATETKDLIADSHKETMSELKSIRCMLEDSQSEIRALRLALEKKVGVDAVSIERSVDAAAPSLTPSEKGTFYRVLAEINGDIKTLKDGKSQLETLKLEIDITRVKLLLAEDEIARLTSNRSQFIFAALIAVAIFFAVKLGTAWCLWLCGCVKPSLETDDGSSTSTTAAATPRVAVRRKTLNDYRRLHVQVPVSPPGGAVSVVDDDATPDGTLQQQQPVTMIGDGNEDA